MNTKRILTVFVLAAAVFCINTACNIDSPLTRAIFEKIETDLDTAVPVTGVTLDKASVTIPVGATEQLTATVEPADATDQSVSWSSDNESVAAVDADGLVTAVAEGIAAVTVTTTDGGFTGTCDVTVVPSTAKEITAYSFTAAANGELSSDVTGTINGTDISATVPYGTDVTALVASFTTTGASVMVGGTPQISGTTDNDFTNPVTYTVTAGDSTTQDYTVTVRQAGDTETYTADSVSFNMHYVPSGGPFTMGEDVESPTQEVTLTRNFWMGETEVTQGLWEDVWGTTWPGTEPSSDYGAGAEYPAYYVNWFDAAAFCNLLTLADDSIADTQRVYYSDPGLSAAYTKTNAASEDAVYVDWTKSGYRLPTEAEWEYTARYIDGSSWNGGDHVSGGPIYTDETDPDTIGDYAWYSGNNGDSGDPDYGSKEVGLKTANALGLKDMSGNVYEWCYDWYVSTYSGGTETDPTGPDSGSLRVGRGGVWGYSGVGLRCAGRNCDDPSSRGYGFGFRLCRTAD